MRLNLLTRSIYRCWPLKTIMAMLIGTTCLSVMNTSNKSFSDDRTGPPNIVVILADDLGYGELGCQGNPEIPTPHIDSIAERGVRFTSAYVTAPNCSPSRAGFLTGRIPTRFGYEFNPTGARNEDPEAGIPREEKTIAELLHDGGYTTGLVGKWHQGGVADYHPRRHGFDEFYGFLHEGHFFVPPPWHGVTTMLRRRTLPGGGEGRWIGDQLIYSTHMGNDEPPYDANNPILRDGQPVIEEAYLTDALTRESVDFIDRHADKPFFLYAAYNAVHSPLQGADPYMERFASIEDIHRRIFAAMLSNLDDGVGEILAKVREEGLEKQTLIIFFSDNGGPTRELTSSNLPLRGGKGQMYEGGLRVPFMMQWPGRIPEAVLAGPLVRNGSEALLTSKGVVDDRPISSMDILPTACAAAGVPIPRNLDGVNLLPFLTQESLESESHELPHDVFYWRQSPKTALRVDDWKIVRMRMDRPWELYDLSSDLSESEDLASEHPGKVEELSAIWERMDGEMAPARF
jgi:arylsulfatase A-like enzyme